jgi:HK97 family phage portal protein
MPMEDVLSFSVVFACVRLIATDIGKLGLHLMQRQESGIKTVVDSPSFSPVLRKPNHFQNRIKFYEQWVISKLLHGNAYVLKQRDNRGVVTRMYVLDPDRVNPLVSTSGEVFYEIKQAKMAGIERDVTVPASEIIHDVHIAPHHQLLGVGPIAAAGLAAAHGLKIQRGQTKFFGNMARPSGMLSAPGTIKDETAQRIKAEFQNNYSGDKIGNIAVGGDGLEFRPFSLSAVDSQVIDQMKFTGEEVARAFGLTGYKVGVDPLPTYTNMAALNQAYYDDCLQELIECIELSLDEGLELPRAYSVEMDLEDLLRMDAMSRYEANGKAVKEGWKSPNEVRLRENLPPVKGGEEPIMQQQNWPLSVLAQRPPPDARPQPAIQPDEDTQELSFLGGLTKEVQNDRFSA